MNKDIKNKGFTLIEILAVITIIGIVALLTVPVVNRIIKGTSNKVFKSNETSLATAAENYYLNNMTQLPPNLTDRDVIYLNDLVESGYIKPIKDIKDSDNNCDGYVIVQKTKDYMYDYIPYLNCSTKFVTDGYYETPPVIKVTGISPMNILLNSTYTDLGATAIDITDGNITANITTTNNVNSNALGTYTVNYSVTNSLGISSQESRTVNVRTTINDTTSPVITLLGTSKVTILKGTTYTDAGATAYDDVDGNITGSIVVNNTVNTSAAGTYVITYNVTDSYGNKAKTVTRTVKVVNDIEAPVITLLGSNPALIIQNTTYVDAGATAIDNTDGNITNRIITVNPVNTALVGSYTITYNVTDSTGNAATQVTRTVNVLPITTEFAFSGNVQSFTVPNSGTYKLEVWGAQGGGTPSYIGGKGGYSSGNITLTSGSILYVYVGGQNGYNGGGSKTGGAGLGGGASDIRLISGDLTSRIIVAGGGGGSGYGSGSYNGSSAGLAGGLTGGYGGCSSGYTGAQDGCSTSERAAGGTSSSGGKSSNGCGGTGSTAGTLGQGGQGNTNTSWTDGYGGGGGGGYYGGGGGNACGGGDGGGGGSSYVGTLTSTQIIAGSASMPTPTSGTETGHTGNGYVKITYIGP